MDSQQSSSSSDKKILD